MKDLPIAARLYVGAVLAAGAVVLALFAPHTIANPVVFVTLLVCSSLASVLKVTLPLASSSSTMSVSYAVDFAALLLLGANETMLVAAVSTWAQCTFRTQVRSTPYRTLFSMASLVLTVKAAGIAYTWLGGPPPGQSFTMLTIAKPLVGAATTYFIGNTLLIATAISLSTQQPIGRAWNENFLWSAPSYFVGAVAAAGGAAVIERGGYWMASLAAAPPYLIYRTYKVYMSRIQDQQRHVAQVSDLHLATIEALALAIDAKDQTAQSHLRRVQMYAAGLAKAAGLTGQAIQGVKTAALLHDIGKLAVPEHILSKPGPLTQEEFQKIRIHPQVGAEIIAAVPFPYPVAPLIMSHHERWDGRGYPQGLRGEEIPIGARILTIVDYFDAITTERPYHKALNNDSAVSLLRHEAGRALDPNLVPLFIEILPALADEFGSDDQTPHRVEPPPTQLGLKTAGVTANRNRAFENIALAHREIYALYEIAQAMGTSLGVEDTMALISSKLSKLVPWSGCSLFLHQPETDTLKCRFAAGVDAPRLLNSTLREGAGLSGWVANNRRMLINGDPRVTFSAAGIQIDTALKSAIICPLHYNDNFIGCLALYHTEPNHYGEDHRRLLERIAEQAGPVIHNSIIFEQTQEDSLTDPLTGLPNRRSMFAHLSRELSRAERLKAEVALIVMDIDGFKQINDTYGHNVGDHALREMAVALQGALRPYDLCVSNAGDEFIDVLSDTSRETADLKRQELQDKIAEIQLEVRAGKRLRLAASAGASVFPHDGATYEALLADADQRMYRDKAARRGHLNVRTPAPLPELQDDLFDPSAPEHPALPLPQTLA